MNAQNVGITWCVLGYGTESPWLLRDCLLDGATAIWRDLPESLPAALAQWPAGVNAVVVVALPTAPHLAELLQALRAHGYVLIVVSTAITPPTVVVPERVLSVFDGAHGVIWIRDTDLLRHELAPTWHNVPDRVASVVWLVRTISAGGMVSIGIDDLNSVCDQRPMLSIGLVDIAPQSVNHVDAQQVALYVESLFVRPLVAELRSSTHFIVQFVSDDALPLTYMLEFATAFEAVVPADAHLIWSMCTNLHVSTVQVVVVAAQARPPEAAV